MQNDPKKSAPLDYRSGETSPYDKPVDRIVNVANFIRGGRRRRGRMLYWLIMLPALALVIWYFMHQMGAIDKLMSPK